MNIRFERNTAKQIASLEKAIKQRMKKGIDGLPGGDVKKLKGLDDTYRLRIGDYRIIFYMKGNDIIIKDIITRGSAYKN